MLDVKELKKELETQDNLSTSHPLFVVYEWEDVPSTSDYTEDFFWSNDPCEVRLSTEEFRKYMTEELEEQQDIDLDELAEKHDWLRYYIIRKRRFVTACFTRKAAERYIHQNKHNLTEPHIYVHSMYRNYEMQEIREYFME